MHLRFRILTRNRTVCPGFPMKTNIAVIYGYLSDELLLLHPEIIQFYSVSRGDYADMPLMVRLLIKILLASRKQ